MRSQMRRSRQQSVQSNNKGGVTYTSCGSVSNAEEMVRALISSFEGKGVGCPRLSLVADDCNRLSAYSDAIALSKRNYFSHPEFVGRILPARFALAHSALDLVY
jgi:hypothetical protein